MWEPNTFMFFFQMSNENMLKPNETCLECKYQLKYKNHYSRKNVATDQKCI